MYSFEAEGKIGYLLRFVAENDANFCSLLESLELFLFIVERCCAKIDNSN
jgi:hypothetical protein